MCDSCFIMRNNSIFRKASEFLEINLLKLDEVWDSDLAPEGKQTWQFPLLLRECSTAVIYLPFFILISPEIFENKHGNSISSSICSYVFLFNITTWTLSIYIFIKHHCIVIYPKYSFLYSYHPPLSDTYIALGTYHTNSPKGQRSDLLSIYIYMQTI